MRQEINEVQIREIAERAFRAHLTGIDIVRVDVKPRLDHDGDPVVDVKFVCDGDYKQLTGERLLRVQSEIVSKAWREVEKDLGFPIVNFTGNSRLSSLARKRRRGEAAIDRFA